MTQKLRVTSVKHRATRRGVFFTAQTNVEGVRICNKGNGGETFLGGEWADIKPFYHTLTEWDLEDLVTAYEKTL